jgi:hypothetical protein
LSQAPRRRAAVIAAALLASAAVGAQPPPRAILLGVDGQHGSGVLTFTEREHGLAVELAVTDLPPGRLFALHLADDRHCPAIPGVPAAARAVVPTVPALRTDQHGRLYLRFTVDDVTLGPGPDSIAGFPVAIYATPDDGGAMLACGPLAPKGFVTTTLPPPPVASLAEARACMDSEDRVVSLVKRGDADQAAVASATTAAQRVELLQRQAAHDGELQSFLKTHTQRCGTLHVSAQDRATVLRERAAAASAAP